MLSGGMLLLPCMCAQSLKEQIVEQQAAAATDASEIAEAL